MFSFFDRISAGWTAAKACLEVLRNDKKLVIFPLLSGISCLIVLASFAIPLAVIKPAFLHALMDDDVNFKQAPIWFWVVLFAFYFVNYFVIYFFNAALVHCALFHFRGLPVTATDGLQAAVRRLPELLAWSLVSATVGLILRLIENANDKFGGLVSTIIGGAWSVVTYFVVPVLVVEGVGPFQAIGRSAKVLYRTWGEAIGGHAGVGWALLPFWLLGILAGVLAFFALSKSVALGVALFAAAVIYMLILSLVDATLKGILLGALYLYATSGEVPNEFDRGVMKDSFTPKQ
jgi:Family of unknown function (DUF6159)